MYRLVILALVVWFNGLSAAAASELISIDIAQWSGSSDQLQVTDAHVDLRLTTQGLALMAEANVIQLPEPLGKLSNVTVRCDALIVSSNYFSCDRAHVNFNHHDIGHQQLIIGLTIQPKHNRYHIVIDELSVASGQLLLDVDSNNKQWQAKIKTSNLAFLELINVLRPYLSAAYRDVLTNFNFGGDLSFSAELSGINADIQTANLEIKSESLDISDTATRYVTEQIGMSWLLTIEKHDQHWQWQTNLTLDAGQAYVQPVFFEFKTYPLSVRAKGILDTRLHSIEVSHFDIDHAAIMHLIGTFSGSLESLEHINIAIDKADSSLVYQYWLQPFLIGTVFDDMELVGPVTLKYQQNQADYQIRVGFDHVSVDDNAQKFGIYDTTGDIVWTNKPHPIMSTLAWQGGHIYSIPVGNAGIKTSVESSILTLSEPSQIPIFDGALQFNEFSLEYQEERPLQWTFDGLLTPISMEALSHALAWPVLHGKLSGVIPSVSYRDQQMKIDGALMLKIFEGTTVIRDLQLNQPFGVLPQMTANIDLVGLDLETLTQTFDFGKITGKLNGSISQLRLSNWQPVQFDAQFATPIADKSRHRISQKAVDNLSQIGGGAGGLLSRSFLRFFEDFSYQRLGLNCILRNGICQMSGIGDTEHGYYIVKGGGLPPRINVVGYTRQVDWLDLIDRLKAVSSSSGPIVQ